MSLMEFDCEGKRVESHRAFCQREVSAGAHFTLAERLVDTSEVRWQHEWG